MRVGLGHRGGIIGPTRCERREPGFFEPRCPSVPAARQQPQPVDEHDGLKSGAICSVDLLCFVIRDGDGGRGCGCRRGVGHRLSSVRRVGLSVQRVATMTQMTQSGEQLQVPFVAWVVTISMRPRQPRADTCGVSSTVFEPGKKRQDQTRISNIDDANDAFASRGRSFLKPGSLRAETSGPSSYPEDPSHPMHPNPFVSAAGPLGAGIYDGRGFGCVGIGRISRIASGTRQECLRNEPGSSFVNCLGTLGCPRQLKKKRGRKPPPEPSRRTEQVREHRRHQCSKSALGPCRVATGRDEYSRVRPPRPDADRSTDPSALHRPTADESGGHREAARDSAPTSRALGPPRTSA